MKPLAFALAAFIAGLPAAAGAACGDPQITFKSAAVSSGDRDDFERELRRAIVKACEWWGPTYDGAFTISIEDSRGPSMALIPAWRGERGQMLFRSGPVRMHQASTEHEVVHVFAPNANRFLAEGLATYAHEHLRGLKAYPNYGVDLHQAAQKFRDTDVAALERLATPDRLQLPGLEEQNAYIVAGSFLRFLIERDGLDKFRRLYALTPLIPHQRNAGDPERWQAVYGTSFADLVTSWRAAIR